MKTLGTTIIQDEEMLAVWQNPTCLEGMAKRAKGQQMRWSVARMIEGKWWVVCTLDAYELVSDLPDILYQMPLPIAIIRYSGGPLFKEEPKTKQHPQGDSEVYSALAKETEE
jgi:hypothetical protein